MKKKRNSSGIHSSFGFPRDKLRGFNNSGRCGIVILVFCGLLAAACFNVESVEGVTAGNSYNFRSYLYNPRSDSIKHRERTSSSSSAGIVFPDEKNDLIGVDKSKKVLNYKGDYGNRIEFPYEPAGMTTYGRSTVRRDYGRRNQEVLVERTMEGGLDRNGGRLVGGPTHKRYSVGVNYALSTENQGDDTEPMGDPAGDKSEEFKDRNEGDSEVPKLLGEFTEYLRGKEYFDGKNGRQYGSLGIGRPRPFSPVVGTPAEFSFNTVAIPQRNCTRGTVKVGDECKVVFD